MLHPDLFHMQGYTKTQNKGMAKDLPTKWRAKINKKQELQFLQWIKQILKQQRYSGKRINTTTRANDSNTQIHRDLDSMRQKINKNIKDSNSDLEQVNLINIYRALHFKHIKYTF